MPVAYKVKELSQILDVSTLSSFFKFGHLTQICKGDFTS